MDNGPAVKTLKNHQVDARRHLYLWRKEVNLFGFYSACFGK